jgi:hypothetical protein
LPQADGPDMEVASTSETLVNFYQTTGHKVTEDSHLHLWGYVFDIHRVCVYLKLEIAYSEGVQGHPSDVLQISNLKPLFRTFLGMFSV